MSNYFLAYCNLIASPQQLNYCKQATSLDDLLTCIKHVWNCDDISNDELLREIDSLNQTPLHASSVNLAGVWLPYRYQSKRQLINWLIPFGHAVEPFQDEYISRCRQHLINQIIQPCTTPEFALRQAEKLEEVKPAGFIFHLSRCGSTLVSGCLSELESTCVFSESPLLTELFLGKKFSLAQQKIFLRAFINLQAAAFLSRPHMIVKWNAWDIFRWQIIRDVFPEVPAIFLVRDPVEILASHYRLPGRHMAGDSSLSSVNSIFWCINAEQTLLDWRIQVLGALLNEMDKFKQGNAILCMDYKHIHLRECLKFVSTLACFLRQKNLYIG
jgi:hypothetical protein